MPTATVVVPTYNERENIRPIATGIRLQLPDANILFVDDSSPDGTAAEIRQIQSQDAKVLLIERPGKLGFASAYIDAFHKIIAENLSDVVITMDADLSHPFDVLPIFAEKIKDHDLVIGSRYIAGGDTRNWTWSRRLVSRAGNWYERTLTSLPIRDVTSGFMCIQTKTLAKVDLKTVHSRGYAFLTELKNTLINLRARFCEVPIVFTERQAGKSKLSLRIALEALIVPIRLFFKKPISKTVWASLVFVISLMVFVGTAPRTIHLNDNAEFVTAAKVLGIPHPTGYPLFVILSKLFTLLPICTIVFRVNFLSIVVASFTLVVLFILLVEILTSISDRKISAAVTSAIGVLSLGFSSLFWSQAIVAKTYMLNLFFVSLIQLLLWRWWQTTEKKYFYWIFVLVGLGLANHSMIALFVPSILIALLLRIKNTNWQQWLIGMLFGIIPLAIYLYLPIRSNMNPIYAWGTPIRSLSSFINFLLPTKYYHLGANSTFADKMAFLGAFSKDLYAQISFGLILSFFGALYLYKKNARLLLILLLMLVSNVLGIIFLRNVNFSDDAAYYTHFYYLPAIAIAFFLAAAGLFAIIEILRGLGRRATLALLGLSAVLPFLLFAVNIQASNWHNFDFLDNYSRQILLSLPSNSVLLVSQEGPQEDSFVFSLLYQKDGQGLRPDIMILGIPGKSGVNNPSQLVQIFSIPNLLESRQALVDYATTDPQFANRPIFTTFLTESLNPNWHSVSNGLVYELTTSNNQKLPNVWSGLTSSDEKILGGDLAGSDLLANYYYAQSANALDNNQISDAENLLIKAFNYDYNVLGLDEESYIDHRNSKL